MLELEKMQPRGNQQVGECVGIREGIGRAKSGFCGEIG